MRNWDVESVSNVATYFHRGAIKGSTRSNFPVPHITANLKTSDDVEKGTHRAVHIALDIQTGVINFEKSELLPLRADKDESKPATGKDIDEHGAKIDDNAGSSTSGGKGGDGGKGELASAHPPPNHPASGPSPAHPAPAPHPAPSYPPKPSGGKWA